MTGGGSDGQPLVVKYPGGSVAVDKKPDDACGGGGKDATTVAVKAPGTTTDVKSSNCTPTTVDVKAPGSKTTVEAKPATSG